MSVSERAVGAVRLLPRAPAREQRPWRRRSPASRLVGDGEERGSRERSDLAGDGQERGSRERADLAGAGRIRRFPTVCRSGAEVAARGHQRRNGAPGQGERGMRGRTGGRRRGSGGLTCGGRRARSGLLRRLTGGGQGRRGSRQRRASGGGGSHGRSSLVGLEGAGRAGVLAVSPFPIQNTNRSWSMGRPVGERRRWFGTAAKLQLGRRHGSLCRENKTRGRSGRSSRSSEEKEDGGEGPARRRALLAGTKLRGSGARCRGRRLGRECFLGRTGMRPAVGGNWLSGMQTVDRSPRTQLLCSAMPRSTTTSTASWDQSQDVALGAVNRRRQGNHAEAWEC